MKVPGMLAIAVCSAVLLASGCAKKDSPIDNAVESTKDALDMRDNEKLKDAGEHVKDALDDAAEGVEDAVQGN